MSKNSELTSQDLEDRINNLINRFEEQQGIIDAYVKRESGSKQDKILHKKEITKLEKDLKKARNE